MQVGGVGSLELRHDGKGTWAGVKNAAELEGALDCDLAFSPLTNLMPIPATVCTSSPARSTSPSPGCRCPT